MNLVDLSIVRLARARLAICSTPSPPYPSRNPIPTFAPSPIAPCPRAYVCAISPSPLAIALDSSLPSSNPAIASSPSAYPPPSPRPLVSSPSACLCAIIPSVTLPPPPISISSSFSPPLGACVCASELNTISPPLSPLPTLAEAGFGIFPKIRHEELNKALIRRYGASITSVKHQGRNSSTLTVSTLPINRSAHFLDDYIPKGG